LTGYRREGAPILREAPGEANIDALITLLDAADSLHACATGWFARRARADRASCHRPEWVLRIMSHPARLRRWILSRSANLKLTVS